jgi:polyisoprenoid-binding protein YceI
MYVVLFSFLIFTCNSFGGTYRPAALANLLIEIPYTMGTHKLKSNQFIGNIDWDPKTNEIKSGELKLAIANIKTDKEEMECHMREALGLDYDASDFPETHICNDKDELPKDGPNSIKYPEITATLLSPLKIGDNKAKVRWMIHGKTKELTMPITLTQDERSEDLLLNSSWNMKLSDFDIIVKKFLFIAVKNDVSLKLTMSLSNK